jgi:hypothetical protein
MYFPGEEAMSEQIQITQIRAVKAKYEKRLLRKKNVVGVGIGLRERKGRQTEEMVLTVLVSQKEPPASLRRSDQIPHELDGVPVDVQVVGELRAQQEREAAC